MIVCSECSGQGSKETHIVRGRHSGIKYDMCDKCGGKGLMPKPPEVIIIRRPA